MKTIISNEIFEIKVKRSSEMLETYFAIAANYKAQLITEKNSCNRKYLKLKVSENIEKAMLILTKFAQD